MVLVMESLTSLSMICADLPPALRISRPKIQIACVAYQRRVVYDTPWFSRVLFAAEPMRRQVIDKLRKAGIFLSGSIQKPLSDIKSGTATIKRQRLISMLNANVDNRPADGFTAAQSGLCADIGVTVHHGSSVEFLVAGTNGFNPSLAGNTGNGLRTLVVALVIAHFYYCYFKNDISAIEDFSLSPIYIASHN